VQKPALGALEEGGSDHALSIAPSGLLPWRRRGRRSGAPPSL
jgi:hypothetical protein